MREVLGQEFFARNTLTVAMSLLGKYLVRRTGRRTKALMITDVEAYHGFGDKASHAHRGRTARNEPMFGPPGRWYVYFVYGMHWVLNVVTGRPGFPAAVMFRGLEGVDGPARLTKAMGIDGRLNGLRSGRKTGLWIEDRGVKVLGREVSRGPRVGVAYAGEWAAKPYRFRLKKSL